MIHFYPLKDSDMQIDGDMVLRFIGGIEKALDDAGNGTWRAFKLLQNLKAMGLRVEADDMPPVQSGLVVERNGAALLEVHVDREAL